MPILTAGNTVYPLDVAKVLISLPDDLLRRLDEYAERSSESRSGVLQRLAQSEIGADDARRTKEFERLLGPPLPGTGDAVRLIKEGREDGKPWR